MGVKPTSRMNSQDEETIERLLLQPCWVIDFLPARVPADSGGQFFAVEAYFRRPPRMADFRRRMAEILLKLNCYFSFRVIDSRQQAVDHPAPEALAEMLSDTESTVMILLDNGQSLIHLISGDLCASVYHPSEALLSLLAPLCTACGLFVWQSDGREAQGRPV